MKESTIISISPPAIFSFNETLSFLDRGFDECLYHLSEASVSRLIPLSDGKGIINVSFVADKLVVELHKHKISDENIGEVESYIASWFDLKRDIAPFYQLLESNSQLQPLVVDYYGSRLIGIPDLFEATCWAVIGQQINLTFAYKMKRSLVEELGEKIIFNNLVYRSFPTPDEILAVDREVLVKMKFSRQKIEYLRHVSQAFIHGDISKLMLLDCPSKNERIEKLVAIKGIGIWSANYILMKSIRDMTCITYGDSGLSKAIHTIFNTAKKPTLEDIENVFCGFENWESYLNFYLWKTLG